MSAPFDTIQTLNNRLQFCEDFAASAPVDQAQRIAPGGRLTSQIIGLKSNIRVAGQAWTAGIAARAGHVAQVDAPLVSRLRDAGALILSRLAMDEGALGAATDNPHFGRCENPGFPGHSSGGSSGGSAAAVAAGAVDASVGSDTMGSVRIPAAYCGVFGLKIGSGLHDMEGVFPLAPSLDALGFFAKTPDILQSVLGVLFEVPASSQRIDGWVAPDRKTLTACHRDIVAFYNETHAVLTDLLGLPTQLPEMDFSGLRKDAFLMTEAEAVATVGNEAGLSPALVKLIDYGRRIPSTKLTAADDRLASARNSLRETLGNTRVVILPTVAQPAFAHGTPAPAGQADFTAIANIAGLPALSIPKPGATPPVSVQLIGPCGSEHALIDLATRLADRF